MKSFALILLATVLVRAVPVPKPCGAGSALGSAGGVSLCARQADLAPYAKRSIIARQDDDFDDGSGDDSFDDGSADDSGDSFDDGSEDDSGDDSLDQSGTDDSFDGGDDSGADAGVDDSADDSLDSTDDSSADAGVDDSADDGSLDGSADDGSGDASDGSDTADDGTDGLDTTDDGTDTTDDGSDGVDTTDDGSDTATDGSDSTDAADSTDSTDGTDGSTDDSTDQSADDSSNTDATPDDSTSTTASDAPASATAAPAAASPAAAAPAAAAPAAAAPAANGNGNCAAGAQAPNGATISLIKSFEGFVASPKPDPIGLPTAGFGHKCIKANCAEVPFSFPLSQATATQLLSNDLGQFTNCLNGFISKNVQLNDNQMGALTSFAFNLGCGTVKSSTLLKRLNNGEDPNTVAAAEIPRFNKAGGKVLAGLSKRRAAEVALFQTPSSTIAHPLC